MDNKKLGNLGEKIAKFYLQIHNFQILKINYRCKFGEIDIIAKKGNYIHFIEVKTRVSELIQARNSINMKKENHIWKCANMYIYRNKLEDMGVQFDAIEVYIKKDSLKINYIGEIIEN